MKFIDKRDNIEKVHASELINGEFYLCPDGNVILKTDEDNVVQFPCATLFRLHDYPQTAASHLQKSW